MFSDDIVQVIVDGGTAYDAVLCSTVHRQGIEIKACGILADKSSVSDHFLQSVPRPCIDFRGVEVGCVRKLGFGAVDLQKRHRVVCDDLFCLRAVIYVIGERGDRSCISFCRAQPVERLDHSHG